MSKSIKRNKNTGIIVVLLIVCAVVFRILGNNGIYPMIAEPLHTFVYIGWGVSVSKRIVQAQVRRNPVAVALLNVFGFVIRIQKLNIIKHF